MLINGNLDILGFIRGLKPDTRATDPEGAELSSSLVWINSEEGLLKWYDGTIIHALADAASLEAFLSKDGGTMTGALVLHADATNEMEATTLQQLEAGLDTKQDSVTGAATTITGNNLTADSVLISNGDGKVAVSSITATELGYLNDVESNIQDQIDGKQANLGFTPVNVSGDTLTGNLNFGGTHTVTNVRAPSDATDVVRLIDIENLTADLDFQADIVGIIADDTTQPVTTAPTGVDAVRYIILDSENIHEDFGTIVGLEDNDIVEYDGENWFVAYDVSERGPGVLVWNRETARWKKFDGTVWTEHGGLSGVTTAAGLDKDGNTIMVKFGGGTTVSAAGGVSVDLATSRGLALVDPTTGEVSTGEDAVLAAVLRSNAGLDFTENGLGIANEGVTIRTINADVVGNGLQGGAGTALSIKLDGTTLAVDSEGLKLGDISDSYLSRTAENASLAGQISVPAPTADSSIANKKYVDDIESELSDDIGAVGELVSGSHMVYDGTATTTDTFIVTHNMGNKFVNVVVYDENDSMIIPDSVVLTDNNNVTVTLESPQKVRIVVTGRKTV
jgi:hypothetical protein